MHKRASSAANTAAASALGRTATFRQMLLDRRQHLQQEVADRLKAGRAGRDTDGGDMLDSTAADVQGDISLSLIQIHAETLTRVDHALARLDAGQYGLCTECGDEISVQRLNALPFAVRCQACEQTREQAQNHIRRRAQQQGNFWLFSDRAGS
jgi:DnaK suppressor protein